MKKLIIKKQPDTRSFVCVRLLLCSFDGDKLSRHHSNSSDIYPVLTPPLMTLTSQPNALKGGSGAASRCRDVVEFFGEAFEAFVF
ncbi:MAG: hypothetical protein IIV05_08380, partial [Ruminococcus sp.]|nr:hypothetical protein [Ruminococcus sp.]